MERPLVVVGSVAVALVLGWGVVSAAPAPPPSGGRVGLARPPGSPAPAVPAVAPRPATSAADLLDWSVLTSYEYKAGLLDVPDAIKALDGKTVTMRGFLMPLYEFDDIHEFVLVATHMSCCFGIPAGINGQVLVHLAQKDGLPNTNEPIEVRGTFHVREKSQEGYVLSIYDMEPATAFVKGY
jgi:hypothetical protein